MKYYYFNILEQANDINRHQNINDFKFTPSKCQIERLTVKLQDNNITILNKNMVPLYYGNFNSKKSVTFPQKQLKLVYNLEESLSFIGGKFILENKKATLIYNGSGLPYVSIFRGSVTKA